VRRAPSPPFIGPVHRAPTVQPSPWCAAHQGRGRAYPSANTGPIINSMNRLDHPDDTQSPDGRQPSDEALARLHRAGWSIGDTAFHDGAGGIAWLVSGSNGENLIRAEGASRDEAWARAVEQARALGMLGE
jgi:hypothetical protein